MFQDLDIRYDNAWRRAEPSADSVALIRREDGILAELTDGRLAFPRFGQLSLPPGGWNGAMRLLWEKKPISSPNGRRVRVPRQQTGFRTPRIRPSVRTGAASPKGEGFGGYNLRSTGTWVPRMRYSRRRSARVSTAGTGPPASAAAAASP